MGSSGFYALYLREHGCAGLTYTACGLIVEELEGADSGLRSLAPVQVRSSCTRFILLGTPGSIRQRPDNGRARVAT